MERLEIVWVSRSAPLVSEIFPDINELWDQVVNKWGLEKAFKACRFSIYCTDTDQSAAMQLRSELADTMLYQRGMVTFGHPEMTEIVENHTLELIEECRASSSLFAFCGSREVAKHMRMLKVSHDMLVRITGYKKHRMEMSTLTYGGPSPKARRKKGSTADTSGSRSSGSRSSGSSGSSPDAHTSSPGHDDDHSIAGTIASTTRFITNFASHPHDPNDAGSMMNILQQSRAKE